MSTGNTALITGVSGQDGSYLAELLLAKGYEVHGIVRRSSTINSHRLDGIYQGPEEPDRAFVLHYGDMADSQALARLVDQIQPTEVYNLAAQSHVAVSFEIPEFTFDITGQGAIRLLEAVRNHAPDARYYQASSSEMFGSQPPPQCEQTPFHPRSPYAVAKAAAHYATQNYREAYGLHASCGILFNHESERRGETFVTQKIARAAARIATGLQEVLLLGNLDARRDWGHAEDFVRAMWLMLQADEPDDFVVATGEAHSVREFCELAFERVGLDWQAHVRTDSRYLRPAEVDHLLGDPSRAVAELGWRPEVDFETLVARMVDAQLVMAEAEVRASA